MQNVGSGVRVEVLVDEQRFPFPFLLFGAGGVILDDPLPVLDLPDDVVEIGKRGHERVRPGLIGLDSGEGGVFIYTAFEKRADKILVGTCGKVCGGFSTAAGHLCTA